MALEEAKEMASEVYVPSNAERLCGKFEFMVSDLDMALVFGHGIETFYLPRLVSLGEITRDQAEQIAARLHKTLEDSLSDRQVDALDSNRRQETKWMVWPTTLGLVNLRARE